MLDPQSIQANLQNHVVTLVIIVLLIFLFYAFNFSPFVGTHILISAFLSNTTLNHNTPGVFSIGFNTSQSYTPPTRWPQSHYHYTSDTIINLDKKI